MNSTDSVAADLVIRRITHLLDETHLARIIDEPIDLAASTLRTGSTDRCSSRLFHHSVAEFVSVIYASGLRFPRRLTFDQAAAEAIALLDEGYRGPYSRGCAAALVDASQEPAGLDSVVAQLMEIIKANERRVFAHWVFQHSLAPLRWSQRCRVAERLLDRQSGFLSSSVLQCQAAQLVDEIPALILCDIGTSAAFDHQAEYPFRSCR